MSLKRTFSEFCVTSRRLREYYWVKSQPEQLESWKKSLTVTPQTLHEEKAEPIPYYSMNEESNELGVPRFWGQEHFGPPDQDETTLGEAMSDQVVFTWQLEETAQKPQKSAAEAWLKNRGTGMLVLPTGCGKTVIAIYLAIQQHRKTLIQVHNDELMHQWVSRIQAICPQARIGRIQGDVCEIDEKDFVIGMIQTLSTPKTWDLSSFGMVIVDECHHIVAPVFSRAIRKLACRYVLGVTATPDRKDGLTPCLHWFLGPMVYRATRHDIVPQTIQQVIFKQGNQKPIEGKCGMALMVNRMTLDPKRNACIDKYLKQLVQWPDIRKIMVFSDRNDHLMGMYHHYVRNTALRTCVEECGKPFELGLLIADETNKHETKEERQRKRLAEKAEYKARGEKPPTKKEKKRQRLEQAKTNFIIFASYRLAQEGLDIDGVNGILLATPYGNTEQVIGRAREKKLVMEGETVYLPRMVYDIVDPFDIFEGMAWKRYRVYRKLGYHVTRIEDGS